MKTGPSARYGLGRQLFHSETVYGRPRTRRFARPPIVPSESDLTMGVAGLIDWPCDVVVRAVRMGVILVPVHVIEPGVRVQIGDIGNPVVASGDRAFHAERSQESVHAVVVRRLRVVQERVHIQIALPAEGGIVPGLRVVS